MYKVFNFMSKHRIVGCSLQYFYVFMHVISVFILPQEEYYVTHQCFLSSRSLYLAVWNVTHGERGIEDLGPWLHNIQVHVMQIVIIWLRNLSYTRHTCNSEMAKIATTFSSESNFHVWITNYLLIVDIYYVFVFCWLLRF